MEEITNNHLGCLQKTYEYWDIDPTSTGCLRFLNHQLRIIGNICCNQKISGILSSPEFPFVKKKRTPCSTKKGPSPKTSPNLGVHSLVPPIQPCCRAQDHAQRLLRRAGPGLGAAGRAGRAAFRRSWSGLHLNRAERGSGHRKGSPFLYRPCMAYVPTFG